MTTSELELTDVYQQVNVNPDFFIQVLVGIDF